MKVLTWNIDCQSVNYLDRLYNIIKIINDENPDIVALQEVKYGSYNIITSKLPNYNYILNKKVQYNRLYGELLLIKDNIINSYYYSYDKSPNIRGITIYETKNYTIATTHLENETKYNNLNTIELKNHINKYDNFIILGDFNYYNNSKLSYDEVISDNTYVSDIYNSRPDRIYIKGFYYCNTYTIKTKLSDHYALVSNLYLV